LYLRWRNSGGASGSPEVSLEGLEVLERAMGNVGRMYAAWCPCTWRHWKRSKTADFWPAVSIVSREMRFIIPGIRPRSGRVGSMGQNVSR
jgi:hypothetical protein